MARIATDIATTPSAAHRLDTVGFGVGIRLVELLVYRERNSRRDIRILDALRFVHSTLWRYLFGRTARDLEQSNNVGRRKGSSVGLAGEL